MPRMSSSRETIDSKRFYSNYYGHLPEHLEALYAHFRGGNNNSNSNSNSNNNNSSNSNSNNNDGVARDSNGEYASVNAVEAEVLSTHTPPIIWLAGDSSLDNKHWFTSKTKAVNGYENILKPPNSNRDIAYWLNKEAVDENLPFKTINCAMEETTIEDRRMGKLVQPDQFVRDRIGPEDILVVSVGGNDIALKPTPCTVLNILPLLCCTTTSCIEKAACGAPLPCDDYLYGCTPSCLSNLFSFPCGFGYFLHLFKIRVKNYLQSLTSKCKPKKILICTIYYPSTQPDGGWADVPLRLLGYDSNPSKLQALITQIFTQATSEIELEGTEVIAVPLFAALNGTEPEDYEQRAEPSASGGSKMARLIMEGAARGRRGAFDEHKRKREIEIDR